MRKVNPCEAQILADLGARVRFRLDGTVFPPRVVYKIFSTRLKSQYLCGKQQITSFSKVSWNCVQLECTNRSVRVSDARLSRQAAVDARRLRGPRCYAATVQSDILEHESSVVCEPSDISCDLDKMRVSPERRLWAGETVRIL